MESFNMPSSLEYHFNKAGSRKCPRSFISWSFTCLAVLAIVATAQAQTFQYSRGWTNGKRSGPASTVGLMDLENGYADMSDWGLLPGHIQMSLIPQARLRALDYNQYLARKFGVGSAGSLNSRKQPLWFGTIMGMDGTDQAAASSQPASSATSNSSPSGSTSDF